MGVVSREVQLAAHPVGLPELTDFELAEVELPDPAEGEVVVRNTYFSLDPAQRIRMHADAGGYLPPYPLGKPPVGWAIGRIEQSRNAALPEGGWLLHNYGWRDVAVVPEAGPRPPQLVTVDDATPDHWYIGALGWTAMTSYAGLFLVAELRPGEDVVFVSGGAGAVGSLVIQLAKLKGNRVIASAGTHEKVRYCTEELGADAAFCYRDGPVLAQLREHAPDGIDVYFDNVGGDHLEAALETLRLHGRIALCGAISTYNATEPVPGPYNLFNAVGNGLTLRGFLASMYADRYDEFVGEMRRWLADGRVQYPETIIEGIAQTGAGFISMLQGGNVGKSIVRV